MIWSDHMLTMTCRMNDRKEKIQEEVERDVVGKLSGRFQ